jgi:hypothetical protein
MTVAVLMLKKKMMAVVGDGGVEVAMTATLLHSAIGIGEIEFATAAVNSSL